MTTHEVKDVEKVLNNIPKHLLSSDLKAFLLSSVNRTNNDSDKQNTSSTKKEIISNVDLVSIPSLGEFGELLEEVSPSLSMAKIIHLKESDLLLLKISKRYTIIFVEAVLEPILKSKDKKEEKEENKLNMNDKKDKTQLLIPKLVVSANADDKNDVNARIGLSMSIDDEFNCLLIGSACCCCCSSNSSNTSLDDIFNIIRKYFSKSMSKDKINSYKKEIEPLWSLEIE